MHTQWFLGANTAAGFQSNFSDVFTDTRIETVVLLKGGPGCGKSTFMKKLREKAQALGADTESYLCSSDPNSLDGLLIVQLGLAFLDGTAPHVVEPRLCGCDSVYLNLGAFYDEDGLRPLQNTLLRLQAQNRACYPVAHAQIACAASLLQAQYAPYLTDTVRQKLHALAHKTADSMLPPQQSGGRVLHRYLHSFTPAGEWNLTDDILASCHQKIHLRGNCFLAGTFLQDLQQLSRIRGYDCVVCPSPLFPGRFPEALLIPSLHLAFVSGIPHPLDCAVLDLNDCCTDSSVPHRSDAETSASAYLQDACHTLAEAKAIHDEIEALYYSHVDFSSVDRLTAQYLQRLVLELAQ